MARTSMPFAFVSVYISTGLPSRVAPNEVRAGRDPLGGVSVGPCTAATTMDVARRTVLSTAADERRRVIGAHCKRLPAKGSKMRHGMRGLEFRDVRKSFGAVRALKGVSFAVAEGSAHALVGENGAGKSTLLKILAGLVHPDGGDIHWHGERLTLSSPRAALERGIGMVYQEMLSFPNLTVSGNIFAGRELTRGGRLREAAMRDRTRTLLAELHLDIDPAARAESLSAAHRQLLQVARALAFDCRVLVLDEPTTALTDAEADHLFAVLQKLRARGVTLLYVSHRMPEVFRLCERVTVLRDGSFVGTFDAASTAPEAIVRAMVGRDLPPRAKAAESVTRGPIVLDVRQLTRRPCFRDVSLQVHSGEIVGLFGLVGSGRSELLE